MTKGRNLSRAKIGYRQEINRKASQHTRIKKSVLFEESHNETWTIERLQALSNSIANPLYYSYLHVSEYIKIYLGFDVNRNIHAPISFDSLSKFECVVIAHPASLDVHKGCGGEPTFSNEEIQAFSKFVKDGGGLLVIGEHHVKHWKSNINELLVPFNISFRDDIVEARYESPAGIEALTQFETSKLSSHPICRGVKSVSFYAACSIRSDKSAHVLAKGPRGESLAVAKRYGKGRICVIGDSDLFALPYILQYGNFIFLLNIIQWLTGSDVVKQHRMNKITENNRCYPTVFLSYAHEDTEVVEKLYHSLVLHGCKPWFDKVSIFPGEKFELAILRGIKNCDFFMPCISKQSSNKRGYLQKEIRNALSIAESLLEEDIYIIPVRFEECQVPEQLAKYQWIDVFKPGGIDRIMDAIKEGLLRRANKQF
ncbi:MAG: toll/interleukin-1 receptor domain-containing protein [Candidatus Edwardsbacteria bacterium]